MPEIAAVSAGMLSGAENIAVPRFHRGLAMPPAMWRVFIQILGDDGRGVTVFVVVGLEC